MKTVEIHRAVRDGRRWSIGSLLNTVAIDHGSHGSEGDAIVEVVRGFDDRFVGVGRERHYFALVCGSTKIVYAVDDFGTSFVGYIEE